MENKQYLRALMTVNRKIAPSIHSVIQPELPVFTVETLDNGLKMNVLQFPEHDILKIEFNFHAGRPEEHQRMTAYMAPRLMREGVEGMDGGAIAEHFDYYGTSVGTWSWLDATGFSLTGLPKHAAHTIPLLADILLRPTFPQKELDILVQTHVQELQVELEKTEVISYRVLTERLYGANHPFGYNSTTADYKAITPEALHQYHQEHLHLGNAYLFVSGNITDEIKALLNQYFGQIPLKTKASDTRNIPPAVSNMPKSRKITIKQPNALQAAVKMGRLLFNRLHPDFYEIQILNTILGGYFGSRLMSNIREEKGYTYNIYSGIDTYYESGYMYIATEVNGEKVGATLRAIKLEMKKLRETLIDDEELLMVRNYMTGALLNGMDGPLNMSAMMRALVFERVGEEGLRRQIQALQTMTPERIRELAQLYLQPDDFLTVVVK